MWLQHVFNKRVPLIVANVYYRKTFHNKIFLHFQSMKGEFLIKGRKDYKCRFILAPLSIFTKGIDNSDKIYR